MTSQWYLSQETIKGNFYYLLLEKKKPEKIKRASSFYSSSFSSSSSSSSSNEYRIFYLIHQSKEVAVKNVSLPANLPFLVTSHYPKVSRAIDDARVAGVTFCLCSRHDNSTVFRVKISVLEIQWTRFILRYQRETLQHIWSLGCNFAPESRVVFLLRNPRQLS